MTGRLVWAQDGRDWPNRETSRFIKAAGLTWHVQQAGEGPALLLVHGTGASTHSWHHLLPILARSFTVVAPDLPGHGFTEMPDARRLSLPAMADGLGQLMHELEVSPVLAFGHSAGAAILIRATLDGRIAPRAIVSLNGALLPFGSRIGQLFSPLARLLVTAPFVSRLMAWRATSRAAVDRLIEGTGSKLSPSDIDLYAQLFQSPDHVAAALGMMASWDLASLARDLSRLRTPLVLVAGGADRAIPPDEAFKVRDIVRNGSVECLRGLGHLAHEENPNQIAEIVLRTARSHSIPAHA